jgi:predicted transcriptional regulator of viral defense system
MVRPVAPLDVDSLALPAAFTAGQAIDAGLTRARLGRLVRDGDFERLGRGLFLRASASEGVDTDLVEIAVRAPVATICLTSALARHGLVDEIPPAIDVAVPRERWLPVIDTPVSWHRFAQDTFMVGKEDLEVAEGVTIGLYSAERSIIDAFRTRGTTGFDLATSALRAWLRTPSHQPAQLLALCRHWPRTEPSLRNALEILL